MNRIRRKAIAFVKWGKLAILVVLGLLYSYFPFPESWTELKDDGTTTADNVWYFGFAFFMVFNALHDYLREKPGLFTNMFMWLSIMFLIDRFVTPYYATPLEWLGTVSVIVVEGYRYYRKSQVR